MKFPRATLPTLLAATSVLLQACTSPGAPAIPVAAPLTDALRSVGSVESFDGAPSPEIVLLKDRHAVGPGIFQVDEELRAFQRDQRAVVGNLVARGFSLLGCEHSLGPLPRNEAARDHLETIERIRTTGDDLNGWSVYQPLRYEVEFAGRLEVVGVEDPALYEADLQALAQIERVMAAKRFEAAGRPEAERLRAEELRLLRSIRANVDERGRLAARNLIDLVRQRGASKALLLLGASHIPAASEELRKSSIRHHIFEARSFRRRSEP